MILAICSPMDSKAPLFGLVEVGTDYLQQRGHAFGCDAVAVFQTDAFKKGNELLCRVGLILAQKLTEGRTVFSQLLRLVGIVGTCRHVGFQGFVGLFGKDGLVGLLYMPDFIHVLWVGNTCACCCYCCASSIRDPFAGHHFNVNHCLSPLMLVLHFPPSGFC